MLCAKLLIITAFYQTRYNNNFSLNCPQLHLFCQTFCGNPRIIFYGWSKNKKVLENWQIIKKINK